MREITLYPGENLRLADGTWVMTPIGPEPDGPASTDQERPREIDLIPEALWVAIVLSAAAAGYDAWPNPAGADQEDSEETSVIDERISLALKAHRRLLLRARID